MPMATVLPTMTELANKLAATYPHLNFVAGESFYWCPETSEVFYDQNRIDDTTGAWSLLHETSHALLGHSTYEADIELLHLEVAAWARAGELAPEYGLRIDDNYMQDC